MDNSSRWNITNSAQNIVSALVDPSKQFDHVFHREWSNTFSGFSKQKPATRSKHDAELKAKLSDYFSKLEERKQIKIFEAKSEAKMQEQKIASTDRKLNIFVPEVFLMEDFDLSNLEIFKEVISLVRGEGDKISTKNEEEYDEQQLYAYQPPQLLTKSQLRELQQSFTDYLDTIEEKLASQIGNRSGDFFQVMSSVDSVMDELSLAIKSVTNLRKKCSAINDALILPNIKTIHLTRTKNNAQLLLDMIKEIAELCKVQPMIQLLLSSSDFNGALELIAKSRAILRKDLTGIVCLKHLESQLVETERVIATMVQQEFLEQQRFVNQFHEERKKRIESNLDIEQWKMVEDVPKDFQQLVSMLVNEKLSMSEIFSLDNSNQQNHSLPNSRQHSRASSDVAISAILDYTNENSTINGTSSNTSPSNRHQHRISSKVSSGGSSGNLMTLANNSDSHNNINNRQQKSYPISGRSCYVLASGNKYVIVNSVINLIRIVMEYCKCAYDIRSLSTELLERLFKILKLYNSKTYHLVYSAGAIQVAGLKTITTRSLVVSQRSLKLISLLIPAIHEHFSLLLPDDNRLKRFDEIKLSYEDHAAKIPERIISIVKDVINLQLQEWEAKPPVPSPQFTAVAQNLMRLHDNIQDALPFDELKSLFLKISYAFKDVLIIHLRRLNITNDAGPQQWLVTQELTFYKISSAKLSVFKDWELNYDDIWTKLNSDESDSTEHT